MIDKLRQGAQVYSVTKRLSRMVASRYDSFMRDSGALSWPSPVVKPLDTWLSSLLGDFLFDSSSDLTLLSRTRSLALWESVVLKDTQSAKTPMPFTNIMVRDSYKAYALLNQYLAPPLPSTDIYLSEENKAFIRWSRKYERLLEQRGLISPCLTTKTVAGFIKEKAIHLQWEVILAGFDEVTPVTSLLISVLKSSGVSVEFWPKQPALVSEIPETLIAGLNVRVFAGIESEVLAVARWVRQKAARGARVAVIVPDLSDNLSIIEREFGAELAPGSVLTGRKQSAREFFAISAARSLRDTPIVQNALDILAIRSNKTKQTASDLFNLLRNPYISMTQDESFAIANLEFDPRSYRRDTTSLDDILRLVSTGQYPLLEDFKVRLISWIDELKRLNAAPKPALPGWWAKHFTSILKILEWPHAGITLTSEEFQATGAFYELLAEFAGLDDITGTLSAREASARLRDMCAYRTHQPDGPDTPILILDPLEAVGLKFDFLWLMGANDKAFPRALAPNPFIPFKVLKELGLPNSSHAREAGFARVLLKRILKSAPEVVVSFCEEMDGRLLRLSPFLINAPAPALCVSPLPSSRFKELLFSQKVLVTVDQISNVPFYPGEMERIRGGTNLIKDQSLCPFMAFAHYRLGARDPDAPEPGLSSMDRGSLVHLALKLFWQEVKESSALIELRRTGLLARKIAQAVSVALEPYRRRNHSKNQYLNLEQKRLEGLLGEWLDIEAKREPFSVKLLEEAFRLTFGALVIKVKIDRVDSVNGAGEVIIDYKSGRCNRKDWFSKRPKEPQMLLYNQTGHYTATAYAVIRHLECAFKGLSSRDSILPGIKGFYSDKELEKKYITAGMTYDDLILSWKATAEQLADSFCAGEVGVDPIDLGENTCACTYCDIKPLCRIFTALAPDAKE